MIERYKPILCVGNQAALGLMPESYLSNLAYPNGALQGEIEFRFINFSIFHQSLYRDINERSEAVDKYIEKHKDIINGDFSDEIELIVQSRYRTAVHQEEDVILSIKSLADETTTVGLWAIVEQFMSRNYVQLAAAQEGIPESEVKISFRWDTLKSKYLEYGVDVHLCDGYLIANECRVLNNKIKHLNFVDDELAAFSNFSSNLGDRFKFVDINLQEYFDGCYHFLGSLIEKTGMNLDEMRNRKTI